MSGPFRKPGRELTEAEVAEMRKPRQEPASNEIGAVVEHRRPPWPWLWHFRLVVEAFAAVDGLDVVDVRRCASEARVRVLLSAPGAEDLWIVYLDEKLVAAGVRYYLGPLHEELDRAVRHFEATQ